MIRKIYQELVLIRKELQAIRGNLESSKFVPEDSNGKHYPQNATKGYKSTN